MDNKQSYNLDEVLAKREHISNIFSKKILGSITHFLVLMMPGCGCTRTTSATIPIVGGAGFANEQTEVGILPDCIQQEKTSILYSRKNTAAAAGEVVENDIVHRRMSIRVNI